jgi:phosphoribosyl 1,2-cyclic phosphodiesterase
MPITAISLQSGSSGNCIYVEAGGCRLLFDAGISGASAEARLAAHGRDIRQVNAVIISHDHSDHVRCAGVYQRKFGLPVYATPRTIEAAASRCKLGHMEDVRHFRAGDAIQFGGLSVVTIPTAHDGADGVAFVVSSNRKRLGILTDLGHPFEGLADIVSTLDAVFLESNYDPSMLRNGPYPGFVKKRIQGPGGHISNMECAELLSSAGRRLKWACLSHLSGNNNEPDLALRTHREVLGPALAIHTAGRSSSTGLLCV